jgi:hypothetical protein
MDQLQRLGDRLDVIEVALSVALEEPEPEHRGRMLDAISAATDVARSQHQEAATVEENRSSFRLVHGAIPPPARPAEVSPQVGVVRGARSMCRTPDHAATSAG